MSVLPSIGFSSQLRDPSQYERPTEQQLKLMDEMFGNWRIVPDKFKAAMTDYLETNLRLNINQVEGFTQQTAKFNQVGGEQGTTSTTFVDLATAGPTITGLADGQYVVLHGASMQAPAAQTMYMGVSVNGGAVDVSHVVESQVTSNLSLAHGQIMTLTNSGNNTLAAKYSISGGGSPGNARYRFLLALRFAN